MTTNPTILESDFRYIGGRQLDGKIDDARIFDI